MFEIPTYREVMHGQEMLIRHYITKFIKYSRDAIYIPFKLQWGKKVSWSLNEQPGLSGIENNRSIQLKQVYSIVIDFMRIYKDLYISKDVIMLYCAF